MNDNIDDLKNKNNQKLEHKTEEKSTKESGLNNFKLDRHASPSPEQISSPREKGYDNVELRNKSIEEKKRLISENPKNKQPYNCLNRFDASTAERVLLYIVNCVKSANFHLRESTTDIHDALKKYVYEYGIFLDNEIKESIEHLINYSCQNHLSRYSKALETHLEELSSLREFKTVSESIEGARKIDDWKRKFNELYKNLSDKMAEYKNSDRNEELRGQLRIAQTMIVSDRFCGEIFLFNGFTTLYTQYHMELIQDCRDTFETVLNMINDREYSQLNLKLVSIDEKGLSAKQANKIWEKFQTSLKDLIKDTRNIANSFRRKAPEKKNNQNRMERIVKNSKNIRTILSQPGIMKFVVGETKEELKHFEKFIKKVLSSHILQRVKSIEEFISSFDVAEAEDEMEDLSDVEDELVNRFSIENVTEQVKEVRKKLNKLANEIMETSNFEHVKEYETKSPKILLVKLEKVARYHHEKYSLVQNTISEKIRHQFEMAIKKACKTPIGKRCKQMDQLKLGLIYLPEYLKRTFSPQIEKRSEEFTKKEHVFKRDLEQYLQNETEDDSTIEEMGKIAERYQQENSDELLDILHSEIFRGLSNYWQNALQVSDRKNLHTATKNMRHIIKYKQYVPSVSEVHRVFKDVCNSLSEGAINCMKILNDMFKIDKTETVQQAFRNVIVYLEFITEFPEEITDKLLPERELKIVEIGLKITYDHWSNISDRFQIDMDGLNIKSLREATSITERWDGFLSMIRISSCRHDLMQRFLTNMNNIKLYSEMISELKRKTADLKRNLDVELISDESTRLEIERDQFFRNLAMTFKASKSIYSLFENILLSKSDVEEMESELRKKVKSMEDSLLKYSSEEHFSLLESDYFRMYYNHLVSFNKYLQLPGVKIQHSLEFAEAEILQKVVSLTKTVTSSDTNAEKVAESLVKMKFFAENFSMFDRKINELIDEALKSYKI